VCAIAESGSVWRVVQTHELIRLFEQEPDLVAGLDPRTQQVARAQTVVRTLRLERGDWRPPVIRLPPGSVGVMVLDGLILRRAESLGRAGVELLGTGDLVRPWEPGDITDALPMRAGVKVCEPTTLAVLDADFATQVCRWPPIFAALFERMSRRATALVELLAIAQLPRLETRLLYLLWHMADRWGRVGPRGVTLPLRLSQQTLADMTAARRPSVSAALHALMDADRVERVGRGGGYVLRAPAPADAATQEDMSRLTRV
jgi:CRP/FNR family cyclic AMP-dependent transcriptional regulator